MTQTEGDWSDDGPTYGPDYTDEALYLDDKAVFGFKVPPLNGSYRLR